MNKILITYYSRSGNTEQVAKELATLCDADLDPIRATKDNDKGWRFIRTLFQTGRQSCSTIEPSDHNPQNYDLVIIGTPVWMSNLSSIARAYLRSHVTQFKNVAFFCTEGRTGENKVFQQMKDEVDQLPIATLVVKEFELKDKSYLAKLSSFSDSLLTQRQAA